MTSARLRGPVPVCEQLGQGLNNRAARDRLPNNLAAFILLIRKAFSFLFDRRIRRIDLRDPRYMDCERANSSVVVAGFRPQNVHIPSVDL